MYIYLYLLIIPLVDITSCETKKQVQCTRYTFPIVSRRSIASSRCRHRDDDGY